MREFNKVSTTLWRSKKFRSLPSDKGRLTYLYLLTCPHGNSAGCFDLHPMYACADLGWELKDYREALDSLCHIGLVIFDEDENTLWITNWDEFNEPTNPKHAIGLLSQLEQASSARLKAIAFHAFLERFRAKKFDTDTSLRKAIEVFLKAYPKAIATETETKREMETEMETRPDQTETETRENPRAALRSVAAEGRDGLAPEGRKAEPVAATSHLLNTRLMQKVSPVSAAPSPGYSEGEGRRPTEGTMDAAGEGSVASSAATETFHTVKSIDPPHPVSPASDPLPELPGFLDRKKGRAA